MGGPIWKKKKILTLILVWSEQMATNMAVVWCIPYLIQKWLNDPLLRDGLLIPCSLQGDECVVGYRLVFQSGGRNGGSDPAAGIEWHKDWEEARWKAKGWNAKLQLQRTKEQNIWSAQKRLLHSSDRGMLSKLSTGWAERDPLATGNSGLIEIKYRIAYIVKKNTSYPQHSASFYLFFSRD